MDHLLAQLVARDRCSPDVLLVDHVVFEPELFVAEVQRATGLQIVCGCEGPYALVTGGESAALSRRHRVLDLCTDGASSEQLAEVALLACRSPGRDARVVFVDTTVALAAVERAGVLPVLETLELVSVSNDRRARPLVVNHPLMNERVVHVHAESWLQSKPDSHGATVTTLRDIADAMNILWSAIDDAVIYEHSWKVGDVLLYDNNRYCRGMRAERSSAPWSAYRLCMKSSASSERS